MKELRFNGTLEHETYWKSNQHQYFIKMLVRAFYRGKDRPKNKINESMKATLEIQQQWFIPELL